MGNYDYKEFYRRQLPHIQPPGATIFVTFRLANSIPQTVRTRWNNEHQILEKLVAKMDQQQAESSHQKFIRQRFRDLEQHLDRAEYGPTWLKDSRIAQLVAKSLRHLDGRVYRLDAFCVMSNHVHIVFAPLPMLDHKQQITGYHPLSRIMHSLKRHTSKAANEILKQIGTSFWEHESYDHYIRNQEEHTRIVAYVLNNPVKVGLVKEWQEWPYSYCRPNFGTI